jgi:hypothetical protein
MGFKRRLEPRHPPRRPDDPDSILPFGRHPEPAEAGGGYFFVLRRGYRINFRRLSSLLRRGLRGSCLRELQQCLRRGARSLLPR